MHSINRSGLPRAGRIAAVTGALLVSACAHDVVLNPAVADFSPKAASAIAQASAGYDVTVADINDVTVSYLTMHPECGLNDQVLYRPAAPLGSNGCITEAEKALAASNGLRTTRLNILSRAEFQQQFALIEAVAGYVKVLAKATEAPDQNIKAELDGVVANLKTVTGGVDAVLAAAKVASPLDQLDPITGFLTSAGALAGELETITGHAANTRDLRKALIKSGPKVTTILIALAADADAWTCNRMSAQSATRSERRLALEAQLPTMEVEKRRTVIREFVAYWAARSDKTCGAKAASDAFKSPIGEMLRANAKANDALIEIGKGKYTPEQRRLIVAATLERLAGMLKGIASIAVFFI